METIGGACLGNEEKEEFCKVVYMFQPRVSVLNNHFQVAFALLVSLPRSAELLNSLVTT